MDNIIKIYLRQTGGLAELSKTIPLYVGMYNTAILDVYVPTTLISESVSVKVGAILTADDGTKATTDSLPMTFKENATVYGEDYNVYELNPFPANFLTYAGIQDIIVNIVTLDEEEVESVVTTQICQIDVLDSALIPDEELSASAVDIFNARITTNEQNIATNTDNISSNTRQIEQNVLDIAQNSSDIAYLEEHMTTGETPIGSLTVSTLTGIETQLNNLVQTVMDRSPVNGDVVMVTLEISGQTDEIYKYFYTASGWQHYQMPPIESASNTDKGIIQGTLGQNLNTQVDITGGQIANIYVKDNTENLRNIREYTNTTSTRVDNIVNGTTKVGYAQKADKDANGNQIIDTYLTQSAGVTKTQMREYALPREFNDVYFLNKVGNQAKFTRNKPTTAVTFTSTQGAIGTYQILSANYETDATFQLSSKNSYSAVYYISADVDVRCQFRLDTYTAYPNLLNTELSNEFNMTANNVYKVQFNSNFNDLDEPVDNITGVQANLSVVLTSTDTIHFTIYSTPDYLGTFNLNTNKYTINIQTGDLGEIPSIAVDGYEVSTNIITFEMHDDLHLMKNNTLVAFKLSYEGTDTSKYLQLVDYFGSNEEYHLKTPYNTDAFNDRPTVNDFKQTSVVTSAGITTISFVGLVRVIEGYGTEIIVNEDDISGKLDKNLGSANAGKFLQIDNSGNIQPVTIPSDIVEGYYYNTHFYADAQHEQMLIGERGKIYIDLATNLEYRYDGQNYVALTVDLIDDSQESATTTYSSQKIGNTFVFTINYLTDNDVDEIYQGD